MATQRPGKAYALARTRMWLPSSVLQIIVTDVGIWMQF
ncbi:hypothetical protein COLO4_34205 [Corchorus olitorius]|uniref:Uncharacterized protein n=1 Tax=Corchorus olitorius TaxID=93759 RepID=A0A1R3GN81_9ROSI|nr:hypothetical protein COLO4_34205 [Corchorus olitorius]